jgi:glyoxylase-like metal-dependent hydrolase (beta-lactamase superfamily II)
MFSPMKQQVIGDEYDVFGDGSVVIFETPGHTPGHSSLQLMMPESGPVLLTGDLYHRTESRELKRVPSFNSSEPDTLASMETFEARADRLGAKVIIQHEPADIEPLGGIIR